MHHPAGLGYPASCRRGEFYPDVFRGRGVILDIAGCHSQCVVQMIIFRHNCFLLGIFLLKFVVGLLGGLLSAFGGVF